MCICWLQTDFSLFCACGFSFAFQIGIGDLPAGYYVSYMIIRIDQFVGKAQLEITSRGV